MLIDYRFEICSLYVRRKNNERSKVKMDKKFALPGLAALAFLALIVGLIGALGGPSNKDVTSKADAATVTAVEQRLATWFQSSTSRHGGTDLCHRDLLQCTHP